MARPRIAATGIWQTSDPQFQPLANGRSYDLSGDPFFTGKLQGFSGMRYTTNFRIAINATPFQQGALRFTYYPNYREAQSKAIMHYQNLRTGSQLPGSDFTTADGGLEVSVPFLSFLEYYDLETSRGDPLNWSLRVQSPLATGAAGPTTVKFTVWIWYTDVELFGATNVQPQSQGSRKKVKTRSAPLQEERPLSTWLSASSKLAASMSGIPLISGLTGPSAYWLKRASTLANSFGYSRPINGEPVRPLAPHYHSALANSDGINVSTNLALNHDASSRLIDDFSPSGMDEMSIAFLKKQWAFMAEFNVSTSTAAGAQVWTQALGVNTPSVVDSIGARYLVPYELLAYLARYYRGGIELDFRFVKTGFHAATLSFSYLTSESPPATVTANDTDLLHRTIVDVQEGSNVCLSFPFISRRTWLETYMNYGAVYVHVVNPLIAPETVASSITVQVFCRGMDDLEFSGLSDQNKIVPFVSTPLIAPQGGLVADLVVPQAGDPTNVAEITCAPVGGTLQEPVLDGLAMMDAMSESITSVLNLLKAGTKIIFPVTTASDTAVHFMFNPSTYACLGITLPSTIQQPPMYCPQLNAVRSMFAYQRGGYELNLLRSSPSTGNSCMIVKPNMAFGSSPVFEFTTINSTGLGYTGSQSVDGALTQNYACNSAQHGLSVTLPYKSLFRVNCIQPAIVGSTYNTAQYRARFEVMAMSYDTAILRPAEDFQLLYFVGVPGLYIG